MQRPQRGERRRADLALGQLPVVPESLVRQAETAMQDARLRPRPAFDGDGVEIGDIILRLNRETGVTVLLVEQQLRFARRVASAFSILEKGRSVAGGPIEELTDDVVHEHLSV